MIAYLFEAIFFPAVTSIFCVLLVYMLFRAKKILEASVEKNRALPNVERLKKSLPLTVSTSWKLGNPVTGVPAWEKTVNSPEADNGIVACQALIQAPAEIVVRELSQAKIMQHTHPLICDVSMAPAFVKNKQPEDADIFSDSIAIEVNVPDVISLSNVYVKWKNSLCLKRRWQFGKDGVSWLTIAPEYKLHEGLFGVWQSFLAIDIPSEAKGSCSSMCLLAVFAAPNSSGTVFSLKCTVANQLICLREHIDSLYLKKMFRKEFSTPKHRSTARPGAENSGTSVNRNGKGMNGKMRQVQSPANGSARKEERGFVETAAEISTTPILNDEKNENEEIPVVNEKINAYKDVIEGSFDSLLKVYEADENTAGWTYLGNRNDVEVYRMQGDATCASDCFKGTTDVKVPLSYALQYCTELEFKKEWDDVFNEGKIVEEIDEVTKIAHMEYKPVWPTTARDFCSITATRHVKGNIYAMAVKAVTHPLCPPVRGKQRAEILVGGFVVEGITEEPPLSRITYITRADLKGKIPASLVNKVNEKQPMYTAVIRGKIEERYLYQDPPDEGGVKIIATRRHPSIIEKPVEQQLSLVDSVKSQRSSESPTAEAIDRASSKAELTEETSPGSDRIDENQLTASEFRELSKEEIDLLNPDSNVQWDTMSGTSISSFFDQYEGNLDELQEDVKPLAKQNLELPRDRFGEIDFKILGNQTAAKLMEEALFASEIDDKTKPSENPDQIGEWTYQGNMKNVIVLRKIHADSNFYSFLGRGIINVLPVTVWEAVKNPSTRFVYDSMLKKTKVVKDIDAGSRIIHMRHETTACFVKQARDFVVLTNERADRDKYVIAGVSVEVPEVPLEKNCVRGKVLASGWIIEPVSNKGKLCSLVTYLSQVDFGGKLPVRLINLIAKRQPMSIAYLRSYLESAEQRG